MFEGWKDVPLAVHRRLADWDVDYYAEKIRGDVEAVRDGHPGDSYEARYSYVLLDEAEAIVAAQEHVYLWPCDCRSIVSKCRKPKDVCLRFSNDRGLGWEISRERAVEILRAADKAGLMHTADVQDDVARHLVDLQLLRRLLLPAPRLGAARGERGVAGAPLRRQHRHGPLQVLRPLRPALPVRGHRLRLRRPAGVRRLPLSRLRTVRDGVQRGRHRAAAARRRVARRGPKQVAYRAMDHDPLHDFELLIRSRYGALLIETAEEDRAEALVESAAWRLQLPVFVWRRATGLRRKGAPSGVYGTQDPRPRSTTS